MFQGVFYSTINMLGRGKLFQTFKGASVINLQTIIKLMYQLPIYSTKKRYHVLTILKSFFSSDTRQSMKRRIATER